MYSCHLARCEIIGHSSTKSSTGAEFIMTVISLFPPLFLLHVSESTEEGGREVSDEVAYITCFSPKERCHQN
jgi:hypothetical protein